MIPAQNVIAWSNVVPWPNARQVEQDLIISRAPVEVFSDELLCGALRFRGGTALNKLHFPEPMRYSEDIDLVRTSAGPIGPILGPLRAVLEPWLGRAKFDQSAGAPKLRFRVAAEDPSGVPIRLKIEIDTREVHAFDAATALPLQVANPWFSSGATIPTFSREEMLATKLRALLQRDKGRDLYDIAHGLEVFEGLDIGRIVKISENTWPFRGRPSRGHRLRNECSPSWRILASCSMWPPCCPLLTPKRSPERREASRFAGCS